MIASDAAAAAEIAAHNATNTVAAVEQMAGHGMQIKNEELDSVANAVSLAAMIASTGAAAAEAACSKADTAVFSQLISMIPVHNVKPCIESASTIQSHSDHNGRDPLDYNRSLVGENLNASLPQTLATETNEDKRGPLALGDSSSNLNLPGFSLTTKSRITDGLGPVSTKSSTIARRSGNHQSMNLVRPFSEQHSETFSNTMGDSLISLPSLQSSPSRTQAKANAKANAKAKGGTIDAKKAAGYITAAAMFHSKQLITKVRDPMQYVEDLAVAPSLVLPTPYRRPAKSRDNYMSGQRNVNVELTLSQGVPRPPPKEILVTVSCRNCDTAGKKPQRQLRVENSKVRCIVQSIEKLFQNLIL
jgi:hypothetical protein